MGPTAQLQFGGNPFQCHRGFRRQSPDQGRRFRVGVLRTDGQRQRDWERDGSGRWPLRISWGGVPGPALARLAATQAGMGRAVGAGNFPHLCPSVSIRG